MGSPSTHGVDLLGLLTHGLDLLDGAGRWPAPTTMSILPHAGAMIATKARILTAT